MIKERHEDFPLGCEELWDITAKALLLRFGGAVQISLTELEQAGRAACVIRVQGDGSIAFEVEDLTRN